MPILPPRLGFKMMSNAPTFFRDFATNKTLDHGFGPSITFTRTGTATYFDSSGTLTTATANTPRFDHDPSTLESKGLLIEEGRTNSLPNSQMSGAVTGSAGTTPTGWGISGNANGLTRTITVGSINGFSYIDVKFVGIVTGGPINLLFDPQSTAAGYTTSLGQTWTSSCYLALIAGSFPSGSTPSVKITERNSSNTFLASSDVSFSIITSTLKRFSVSRTLDQSTVAKVTLDIRVDSVPNGTSVDFTLRIAAPQLELGAFATSYIPTTSVAVSRGADVAIITPITSFYNQSEMSLFGEIQRFGTSTFSGIISLHTDANSTTDEIYFTQARSPVASQAIGGVFASTSGTIVGIDTGASFTNMNEITKVSSGVKSGDFFVTSKSSTSTTGTGSTSASQSLISATKMRIGARANSTTFLNGHIRKVGYWPRRLTNANLQAMTA